MRYLSTHRQAPPASFAEALARGPAPDGGLYLPERVPVLDAGFWRTLPGRPLHATAEAVLSPYLEGEVSAPDLARLVADALDFPIPLVPLEEGLWLLELFHGPTLAFKDVGARFLARLLPLLAQPGRPPATVLVATSGDTGGAVAQAFHGVAGTRVVVLYPLGQVSPTQERQLATLGGNVLAVAVQGTFDDCQRLVKQAFADPALAPLGLTSANSINVGRLLPQIVYYLHARAQLPSDAPPPVFATPSGNFGNLTAGLLARRMGLACRRFVAAVNANDVVPDFLATGSYTPRPSLPTLANAMDVGDPSNLARIRALFNEDLPSMNRAILSSSHSDDAIRTAIRDVHHRTGTILDPHTAVGYLALQHHRAEWQDNAPAILLATAHPAKFREIVEPILGISLPLPPQLAACMERPLERVILPADYKGLARLLSSAPPPAG